MRTLVIGDIHGGLRALEQLLETVRLSEDDMLIFLGDYVDGWSESAQVISRLIELSKTNDCVFIKGNHDVWCEDWLNDGTANPIWLKHGGEETIESYTGFTDFEKNRHLEFFEAMPLYHIDDDKRLFLHAGFTSMHGVEHEIHKETLYYDRTLWEMALTMDRRIQPSSDLYPKRLIHYTEIYIGHTPTLYYQEDTPMKAANVYNLDTGAAFTGKLSAMDIISKKVFQSDTVMHLYPHEMGRNK
ncbi:metallophosphoesterase family protein [Winogradskyella aurantia]|uniref:Serine/threonine protein phosphatase n=1 Tax=Winogradskyella aurantia TaxID=1915063 RepID=A0A265UVG1_9FLAO|nr:metallophosphoesterase family protein [Winogradskyella aurantia]OZV69311.1 serine/threonine protein phosphatase [Winogradskyella aurantia]